MSLRYHVLRASPAKQTTRALAAGLQSAGVIACGKHFPGHGDTSQDSHVDLPHVPHPRARLDTVELHPFRALAKAGLASIMTAHVVFAALDPGVPATLSRRICTELLRTELGFEGVVFTDDLTMAGIASRMSEGEAAVRAIAAGADMIIVSEGTARQRHVLDALTRAADDGHLSEHRLTQSLTRIDNLITSY